MADGKIKLRKLTGTPEWLFPWRDRQTPLFPKLLAFAFVGAAFTLLLSLKVRVAEFEKSVPRRASVIYLRDDAQGRALTLRAQEGGPFPSRFKPENWEGFAKLEAAGMDATRFQVSPYLPQLQDLPLANQLHSVKLAAKGESFFPKRRLPKTTTPDLAKLQLAPSLYPLSGITSEMLPRSLPPFTAAIDSAMSSASWRFLLRLNSEGSVSECVSLEKGGETGAAELETWLQKIQFQPDHEKSSRWISLGVGFINQPTDGTDAR